MEPSDKYLNKLIVAKTAQGCFKFAGRCVSYCEAPTLSVRLPDGTTARWRADLCEVIEIDERVFDMLLPLTPPPAPTHTLSTPPEK